MVEAWRLSERGAECGGAELAARSSSSTVGGLQSVRHVVPAFASAVAAGARPPGAAHAVSGSSSLQRGRSSIVRRCNPSWRRCRVAEVHQAGAATGLLRPGRVWAAASHPPALPRHAHANALAAADLRPCVADDDRPRGARPRCGRAHGAPERGGGSSHASGRRGRGGQRVSAARGRQEASRHATPDQVSGLVRDVRASVRAGPASSEYGRLEIVHGMPCPIWSRYGCVYYHSRTRPGGRGWYGHIRGTSQHPALVTPYFHTDREAARAVDR